MKFLIYVLIQQKKNLELYFTLIMMTFCFELLLFGPLSLRNLCQTLVKNRPSREISRKKFKNGLTQVNETMLVESGLSKVQGGPFLKLLILVPLSRDEELLFLVGYDLMESLTIW